MKYEREVIQEIWRTSQCTFNVVYPTTSVACIKGMRGELSRKGFGAIIGILAREGFKTVLYERLIDGVLVEKTIKILDKYKLYDGSSIQLREGKCNGDQE